MRETSRVTDKKLWVNNQLTGLQQLSSAISTAGSVAQMSGVSMEKFTAEIGALIEQTGMSGSEAATG